MQWALVDSENKVLNLIVYDDEAPYTAPAGQTLKQVADTVRIGDTVSGS